MRAALQQWRPWGDGDPPWRCVNEGTVEAGGEATVSPEILPETPRPAPLPPGIPPASLRCGRRSLVGRLCGHASYAPCEEAFSELDKPCQEEVEVACAACGDKSTGICSELAALAASGRQKRCLNKVEKLCTICEINTTIVECFRCVQKGPRERQPRR